jgi:predicted TIM-barrel fold metal-dependent hydrolase
MKTSLIQAIDVHGHIGVYGDKQTSRLDRLFMSGDAATLIRRARAAQVRLTFVSAMEGLYGDDVVAANRRLAASIGRTKGLRQWVVVDPLRPKTYEQASRLLRLPTSIGIKIHPELHGYPIQRHGRELFEFAEREQAIVQSHSGESRSLPMDFVKFANDFPTVPIILSHLGFGADMDMSHQVRAIQSGRHRNLYTDTSSGRSVTANLIEWAVSEIGDDRILFGTDTPLYFAPMQRARIDCADIRTLSKRKILCENAERLFGL